MSICVRPQLHGLLEGAEQSRTLAQTKAMGVELDADTPTRTVVEIVASCTDRARRLLAAALLDYVLRLDPLVSEVRLKGIDADVVEELDGRLPLEVVEDSAHHGTADYRVAVGGEVDGCDLLLDAEGWLVAFGEPIEERRGRVVVPNPVGPLAAAALGAAEVFKALFALNYPTVAYSKRFLSAQGNFSFFDYSPTGANPLLEAIELDTFLVGLGGVGAGFVRTLGELGGNAYGRMRLIDLDCLSIDNLNRVTYGTLAQAQAEELKVEVAATYLRNRLSSLIVSEHSVPFEEFKRSLASTRNERRYDVVVTALDNDEIRHEVQRDLPRVLIDGATGRDLNMVVERVLFGQWGCLGCTRHGRGARPAEAREGEGCGNAPEPRAPAVSFLSAFPGILAAGELIKESMGAEGSLCGSFEHIFNYPLSAEMVTQAAQRDDCQVRCKMANRLDQYRLKYGD